MSNLKLLGALLLTVGGTTQLLYAEQPSVIINSNIVQQKSTCSGVVKDASGESLLVHLYWSRVQQLVPSQILMEILSFQM